MRKACCGFGHREIYENINSKLDNAIDTAVKKGCTVFYTGSMGDFDRLFSAAVRKAKKANPHIKLICVKPYFTNDINTNKEYYSAMYDDLIIPDELAGVHPKAAIKARNRWIVDKSDIIITYLIRNHGGAYEAVKYARRNNTTVVQI